MPRREMATRRVVGGVAALVAAVGAAAICSAALWSPRPENALIQRDEVSICTHIIFINTT